MRSRADATPGFLWVEGLGEPGARLTLDAESSRYVARVCRARSGERCHLTDGAGGLAKARVVETRPHVVVEIESREHSARERTAILLSGAPEGQRADWLVEKLAELGLAVFQPVDCERASWERTARRFTRWQRVVRSALRQSRSRFLLDLRPPLPLQEALATLPAAGQRVLATPDGLPAGSLRAPEAGSTIGLVGPAGGLADSERTLLRSRGFQPIVLADNRLRTETAAVALAALWASQSLGPPRDQELRSLA